MKTENYSLLVGSYRCLEMNKMPDDNPSDRRGLLLAKQLAWSTNSSGDKSREPSDWQHFQVRFRTRPLRARLSSLVAFTRWEPPRVINVQRLRLRQMAPTKRAALASFLLLFILTLSALPSPPASAANILELSPVTGSSVCSTVFASANIGAHWSAGNSTCTVSESAGGPGPCITSVVGWCGQNSSVDELTIDPSDPLGQDQAIHQC